MHQLTGQPASLEAYRDDRARPDILPGLTVVLPCYNEAENVARAISEAATAAARCAANYEIVVVDDGSRDDTATIAGRIASRDARVRLVVHATNLGYGDALRCGIAAAQMPWVLLTDADLQFDLADLDAFLPAAQHADLVVGWRILRHDAWHRRANAAAWNWLVRWIFGLPVRDVDCAFKLIRTDLLQACDLRATGAMISTELLVTCLNAGARIEQLGVHHHPRVAGHSTGASPRVIVRAFRELFTLRRGLRGLEPMQF